MSETWFAYATKRKMPPVRVKASVETGVKPLEILYPLLPEGYAIQAYGPVDEPGANALIQGKDDQ